MRDELEDAVQQAIVKLARFVEDAAAMTVETCYVEVGQDLQNDPAKQIARTIFNADGDCQTIIPMRHTNGRMLEIDRDLLELHDRNVAIAVEYRARLVNALLEALQIRQ